MQENRPPCQGEPRSRGWGDSSTLHIIRERMKTERPTYHRRICSIKGCAFSLSVFPQLGTGNSSGTLGATKFLNETSPSGTRHALAQQLSPMLVLTRVRAVGTWTVVPHADHCKMAVCVLREATSMGCPVVDRRRHGWFFVGMARHHGCLMICVYMIKKWEFDGVLFRMVASNIRHKRYRKDTSFSVDLLRTSHNRTHYHQGTVEIEPLAS